MFKWFSNLTRSRIEPVDLGSWPLGADSVFVHATHPKAGSQWVQAILMDLFGASAVANLAGNGDPDDGAFEPGRFYLSRYLSPDDLSRFAGGSRLRTFFVMRDLRDTLVSLYFSLKVSHEVLDEFMAGARAKLQRVSEEDGLIYLIETQLQNSARLQKRWLSTDPEACVKFESLTADPVPIMTELIQQRLDLDLPSEAILRACERFAFERLTGGRKKGEEDARSHFRSGAAGGWRKHFSPAVTGAFAEEFGSVIVASGYEGDTGWADETIREWNERKKSCN